MDSDFELAPSPFSGVDAAPHLPAGILSPYSDGERGALVAGFANHQRCKKDTVVAATPLLPVTIRGEVPGRAMRGGADLDNCPMTATML
ncbi:hypothetical protein EN935_12825 [Mesorhizobium sp. M7D.F.Ca.US.004.03.1.1]|nr:hypothetical protein EN993_03275 [Mesorhizobium sp. M7D.F.Ca.US.004.01.2.1]RVA31879.1 hypothetical protein EN935_12825 [Mesorhizobium sp. M7D.F.Ca.US.004.03.1.1]